MRTSSCTTNNCCWPRRSARSFARAPICSEPWVVDGNENAEDASMQKLTRKKYEKDLQKLQAELCILQEWVKANGLRVIVIFEGRDGAGKGGTIRAVT